MNTLRSWLAGVCLLGCTFTGALLFAPVFGVAALVPALVAVALVVTLVDGLALAVPRAASLRPPVILVAGAFTVARVTGVQDLLPAVRDGWVRTAQATWPIVDRPDLLAFVPLLALLAAALVVEVLRRSGSPLSALAPALVPLLAAQAFVPTVGRHAVEVALVFAGLAVLGLVLGGAARVGLARPVATVAVLVAVGAPLGLGTSGWSALHRAAYTVHSVPADQAARAENPLDDIAGLLAKPGGVAFRVRTGASVDRWPLVVYNGFDGDNWTSDDRYQPLGGPLAADPGVGQPLRTSTATITPVGLTGPWLPSRDRPVTVGGASVLVDPVAGTLVRTGTVASYRLTWAAPSLDGDLDAPVDPTYGGGMPLGNPPASLVDFAQAAVSNQPPSLRTALSLEAFFHQNYKVATGAPLPTGHGYAQLQHFLGTTKRGTSEQFATSYVILARLIGIPARLVVGFRQPAAHDPDGTVTVHDGDVLAWPEVAVSGYGWVPLDPTSSVTGGATSTSIADAASPHPLTSQSAAVVEPPPATAPPASARATPLRSTSSSPRLYAALTVGLLVALWVIGVPVGKRMRARRRRSGPPSAAVVGAWRETRDRLRDHGVRDGSSMTVRDVASHAGDDVAPAIRQLAGYVDQARWSGTSVTPATAESAWHAAHEVRSGLRSRGRWRRVRAELSPRTLTHR